MIKFIKNRDGVIRIAKFDIEDSLGHLVAKVHQRFSSRFKEKLAGAGYGITPPQFGTLAFLWKYGEMSQVQLGEKMYKDRTTISGIIDRLEKEGLVSRCNDPDDRRIHMVYLTPRGMMLREELEQLAELTIAEVTAMLSGEERDTLRRLLKKIHSGGGSV